MRNEIKARRQEHIERAAYAVLDERGYASTSMLSVARAARASNETLYNWYGDKTGLFRALVRRNAADVRSLLEQQIATGQSAVETLARVGPLLLSLVTSDRAVALNRAAAADSTEELGRAIAQEGRDSIAPLVARVMALGREQGEITFTDLPEACETWLSLLIGDWQIRRAIGRLPQPDAETIAARADRALRHFLILYPPAPPTDRISGSPC